MSIIHFLIEFVLHIDKHLIEIVNNYHNGTYLILFLIVFAETGFVVTPFLPGDSLLFATGALAARLETGLNIFIVGFMLILAALCGDIVNYFIGKSIGHKAVKYLKKSYLDKTHEFYQKHGGKTIIYARFAPIVRTFAPFVAGIGEMEFKRYILFGILGSVLWVFGFLSLGYFFGNLPLVKKNFTLVIFVIIGLSILVPLISQKLKNKTHESDIK